MKSHSRIILGIDPGTTIMGYGLIGVDRNQMTLITLGCIHLNKYQNHAIKLRKIFERTVQLIDTHLPDELAIEAPFYGKNVQSMLKLGRAQGVAIAAALQRDIPFVEYAPKRIKQAVTGNGNASKEQVAGMLESLFGKKAVKVHHDATDGLAAAVCHFLQKGKEGSAKTYNSWKAFLSDNPSKKI